MSFNGFAQFEKNLRTMMDSEAYKNADESKKLKLGYCLINFYL